MKSAPLPQNESERLNALEEYNILDTMPEVEFDDITRIASHICGTPISLVTLLDENRQWFKSKYGLNVKETPRNLAFCGYTLLNPEREFIVEDSSKDERFFDNPLVTGEPHVAFYGGIPLVNPEGYVLGALCVIDHKPNNLNKEQIATLHSLGRQIVALLELRRTNILLNQKQIELKCAYDDLEQFSYIASHDLKSPLSNIVALACLIRDASGGVLDTVSKEYLDLINTSSRQLSRLIDGILEYSRSSQLLVDKKELINISALLEEVKTLINVPSNFTITWNESDETVFTSKIALTQILMNLINNAIKYNDKEEGRIGITFEKVNNLYVFNVVDNGKGISDAGIAKMFDLFQRLKETSEGSEGTGIGLAVVKRLVEKIGGSISVASTPHSGTTFIFSVANIRTQPALIG